MLSTETLAIACGIGSAAAWGAGDFSGGMASHRGNMLKVVWCSQFIGGLFLLGMAVFSGEIIPPVRQGQFYFKIKNRRKPVYQAPSFNLFSLNKSNSLPFMTA